MATVVVRVPRVRADDVFFPALALLLLAIVVTGFGATYFFAGMIFANLPNRVVHVHGAVFVLSVLLLVTQTWLVAAHKTSWHMKLGLLALILVPGMAVLGVITVFDFIRRAPSYEMPELLLVGDFETLALFVVFTSWGLLARRDSAAHKRLMMLAMMSIMGPAIGRWNLGVGVSLMTLFALPLSVLAYDLWALKRVHRTTAVANASIAVVTLTLLPFSRLPFWHHCVEWIRQT